MVGGRWICGGMVINRRGRVVRGVARSYAGIVKMAGGVA